MTLKLGMQHRVHEYYQVCSNDGPGLTLTYFTARSNLVVQIVYKSVAHLSDVGLASIDDFVSRPTL